MALSKQLKQLLFDVTWNEGLTSLEAIKTFYAKKKAELKERIAKLDGDLEKLRKIASAEQGKKERKSLVGKLGDEWVERDQAYKEYIDILRLESLLFGGDITDECGDINLKKLKVLKTEVSTLAKSKTVIKEQKDEVLTKNVGIIKKSVSKNHRDFILNLEKHLCENYGKPRSGDGDQTEVVLETGEMLLSFMDQCEVYELDSFIDLDEDTMGKLSLKAAGCCGKQALDLIDLFKVADKHQLYVFRYNLVADYLSTGDPGSSRMYQNVIERVPCADFITQTGQIFQTGQQLACYFSFEASNVPKLIKRSLSLMMPKLPCTASEKDKDNKGNIKPVLKADNDSTGREAIQVFLKNRCRRLALNFLLTSEMQLFDPNIGDASCELRPAFLFWAHKAVRKALKGYCATKGDAAPSEESLNKTIRTMVGNYNNTYKGVPWDPDSIKAISTLTNCGPESEAYYEFYQYIAKALDQAYPCALASGHSASDHLYLCYILGLNKHPVRDGMGTTTGGNHNVERDMMHRNDLAVAKARLGWHTVNFLRHAAKTLQAPHSTKLVAEAAKVLNACEVVKKHKKDDPIPLLPIYTSQRVATMYAFENGIPLVLNVSRIHMTEGKEDAIYKMAAEASGKEIKKFFNYTLAAVRLCTYMPNHGTGKYELVEDKAALKKLKDKPAYFATGYSLHKVGTTLPDGRPEDEKFFYSNDPGAFFEGFCKMNPLVHVVMGAAKHPPFEGTAIPAISKLANSDGKGGSFDQVKYLAEHCFGAELLKSDEVDKRKEESDAYEGVNFGDYMKPETVSYVTDNPATIFSGAKGYNLSLLQEIASFEDLAIKLDMLNGTYGKPVKKTKEKRAEERGGKKKGPTVSEFTVYLQRRTAPMYYYTQHLHATTLEYEQARNARFKVGESDPGVYDAHKWVEATHKYEAEYLEKKYS